MCQPGRPRPHGESHHGVLARLVRLPEREVARILLARVRLLLLDLVGPLPREAAVLRPARDAEVDVAVDLVGEAALDQVGDEARRSRPSSRSPSASGRPRRGRSGRCPRGTTPSPRSRALGARPGRRLVDLVVHVGDVVDERDVVAAPPQPAREPGADDERPRVADVRPRVDGRAADVHPDRPGRLRQLDEPALRVL